MKRFITTVIYLFTVAAGYTQDLPDTATTDIAAIYGTRSIVSKTMLYIDSSSSATPEEVFKKTFFPLSDFKYRLSIPADMIGYAYFLKFSLLNSADSVLTVFLRPGAFFSVFSLYKIRSKPELLSGKDDNTGYCKITLLPHEQATVLAYLRPAKSEMISISPAVIAEDFLENFKIITQNYHSPIKTFGFIISGILLMMILFMSANFIISKKKEFLFNCFYSVCMFLLIYLNTSQSRSSTALANFYYSYFDFFLLLAGAIFYFAFTRKFLNTSVKYVLLDKVLKYGEWFIFFSLLVYTGLHFFTNLYPVQNLLENIIKFLILGIGVYFVIMALRQKNRLLNYLAAGNAALVIFSFISLGVIWSDIRTFNLFTSSTFYYYLGIIFELSFFLLGLTYKNRSDLIERIKEQEAMKLEAGKKEYETQIAMLKVQQEERNRISADMHDDLGAGMTTIRLYSELAKSKLGDAIIPEIEKISSSSNELLNKMNAIIWSMSSSNDTLGNLTAYIRSYALEYFENTGITCRISIPENLPNIEVIGEIRRNVFLVVKEALNNILKHAKATEVIITLMRVPDGLTLLIKDNGIGINFKELRQFGNGLKNMQKRMEDVNIEFGIKNNNGTLITLYRKINQPGFF